MEIGTIKILKQVWVPTIKNTWGGEYQMKEVLAVEGDNFSSCCGSSIGEDYDFFRGIQITNTEEIEMRDDYHEITVIKTRNGPISVKIGHTWEGDCPSEDYDDGIPF